MTRIVRDAFANMRRRPLMAALATGTIAVALLLVATVYLATRNVESAAARWGGGVHMVVYLDEGVAGERAHAIGDALAGLAAVERVEYVAPEAALERLRGYLGEHDELVAGIEVGMLPASLEITLGDGIKDVAAAHPIIDRLEATVGVEEVEFLGAWVEQITTLTAALHHAGWFLVVLVGLACVYIVIVATTLRLSGQLHRDEAAALDIMGASRGFVRAPLIAEGVLQGVMGAMIAAGILWLLFRVTAPAIAAALPESFAGVEPAFLPTADIALLIAIGGCCGLLGSWLATGRRALA